MRGDDLIIPLAMQLRAAAPTVWNEFLMALRQAAAIKATELVRAPPESIHQMQGQARALEELVTTLMQAPEKYAKAEELKHGNKRHSQPGA